MRNFVLQLVRRSRLGLCVPTTTFVALFVAIIFSSVSSSFAQTTLLTSQSDMSENPIETIKKDLEVYTGYKFGREGKTLSSNYLELHEKVANYIIHGGLRGYIVTPTSSGKEKGYSHLIQGAISGTPLKALVITNYVSSAKKYILNYTSFESDDVGLYWKENQDLSRQITVITPTLAKSLVEKGLLDVSAYPLVILDGIDREWDTALGQKTIDKFKKSIVIGYSSRSESIILPDQIFRLEINEAIQNRGILADLNVVTYEFKLIDIAESDRNTHYEAETLGRQLMMHDEVTRTAFEAAKLFTNNWTEPFIINCSSVDHAKRVAEKFTEWGAPVEAVYGGDKDRTGVLDRFERGITKGISNVFVLSKGYINNTISVVENLDPTLSDKEAALRNLGGAYMDGKTNVVIEFVYANTKRNKNGEPTQILYPKIANGNPIFYKGTPKEIQEKAKQDVANKTKASVQNSNDFFGYQVPVVATSDAEQILRLVNRVSMKKTLLTAFKTINSIEQFNEAIKKGTLRNLIGADKYDDIYGRLSMEIYNEEKSIGVKNIKITFDKFLISGDNSYFRTRAIVSETLGWGWMPLSELVNSQNFLSLASTHGGRWQKISKIPYSVDKEARYLIARYNRELDKGLLEQLVGSDVYKILQANHLDLRRIDDVNSYSLIMKYYGRSHGWPEWREILAATKNIFDWDQFKKNVNQDQSKEMQNVENASTNEHDQTSSNDTVIGNVIGPSKVYRAMYEKMLVLTDLKEKNITPLLEQGIEIYKIFDLRYFIALQRLIDPDHPIKSIDDYNRERSTYRTPSIGVITDRISNKFIWSDIFDAVDYMVLKASPDGNKPEIVEKLNNDFLNACQNTENIKVDLWKDDPRLTADTYKNGILAAAENLAAGLVNMLLDTRRARSVMDEQLLEKVITTFAEKGFNKAGLLYNFRFNDLFKKGLNVSEVYDRVAEAARRAGQYQIIIYFLNHAKEFGFSDQFVTKWTSRLHDDDRQNFAHHNGVTEDAELSKNDSEVSPTIIDKYVYALVDGRFKKIDVSLLMTDLSDLTFIDSTLLANSNPRIKTLFDLIIRSASILKEIPGVKDILILRTRSHLQQIGLNLDAVFDLETYKYFENLKNVIPTDPDLQKGRPKSAHYISSRGYVKTIPNEVNLNSIYITPIEDWFLSHGVSSDLKYQVRYLQKEYIYFVGQLAQLDYENIEKLINPSQNQLGSERMKTIQRLFVADRISFGAKLSPELNSILLGISQCQINSIIQNYFPNYFQQEMSKVQKKESNQFLKNEKKQPFITFQDINGIFAVSIFVLNSKVSDLILEQDLDNHLNQIFTGLGITYVKELILLNEDHLLFMGLTSNNIDKIKIALAKYRLRLGMQLDSKMILMLFKTQPTNPYVEKLLKDQLKSNEVTQMADKNRNVKTVDENGDNKSGGEFRNQPSGKIVKGKNGPVVVLNQDGLPQGLMNKGLSDDNSSLKIIPVKKPVQNKPLVKKIDAVTRIYLQVVQQGKAVNNEDLGDLHDQLQGIEHITKDQIVELAQISRGKGITESQASQIAKEVMNLLEMYSDQEISQAHTQEVLKSLPKGYVYAAQSAGDPVHKGIRTDDHRVQISSYEVAKMIYSQAPVEGMTIEAINHQVQSITETVEQKTARLQQTQKTLEEKTREKDHENKFEDGRP